MYVCMYNLEKDPVELRANNFIHCYRLKRCFSPLDEECVIIMPDCDCNASNKMSDKSTTKVSRLISLFTIVFIM